MTGKKTIFNLIFLAAVFSLTMYFVFRGEDIEKITAAVREADGRYLIVGLICVVLFIIGESVIIFYMMRTLGAKVKMSHCALYSFVGFFFSCITPSATGGQPMQIYYMKKDKLPIPVTTLVLMIVTITYKAVLVFIGILVCLFGRDFLRGYLGDFMWVFYLGVGLNVFCVTLMMTLVFAPGLAKWLMVKGLKIMEHIRIMKPRKERLKKLEESMDQYHDTAAFWASHKRIILNVFLITFVQRCILFTVTYWVYRSLGLHGYNIAVVSILQSVISVSVDMLPLPGGMGISETLYMVMFVPVFGKLLLPSMLLSRGIAYYGQMLISALMTCVAHIVIGGNVRKKENISC
ncbi:YbhN family protein [Ruminococcus sp. 5_1_39BFAA]|uniref:lysylphosphatidylglycerol synthase transmembrane domain-containing protein n=1 Tax=Ruminococcus sp. 5_1_39BFAA TaxID=457412 RepID=UPI003569789A